MRFTEHLFLVSVQHPVINEKTLSTEALVIGTLMRKEANAVMFGVCVLCLLLALAAVTSGSGTSLVSHTLH